MAKKPDPISGLMSELQKKGIEYLRFEMPDLHGVSRSKTVPIDKVEDYARRGLNFYGGVLGLDTASNVVPASGLHTAAELCRPAPLPDPGLAPRHSLAAEYGERRLPRLLVRRRAAQGGAALRLRRACQAGR